MSELQLCLRKKAYSNKTANKVIVKVYNERKVKLRKYVCAVCGHTHLTSKDAN